LERLCGSARSNDLVITSAGSATSKQVDLGSTARLLFVGLHRLAPGVLDALKIIRPQTAAVNTRPDLIYIAASLLGHDSVVLRPRSNGTHLVLYVSDGDC